MIHAKFVGNDDNIIAVLVCDSEDRMVKAYIPKTGLYGQITFNNVVKIVPSNKTDDETALQQIQEIVDYTGGLIEVPPHTVHTFGLLDVEFEKESWWKKVANFVKRLFGM